MIVVDASVLLALVLPEEERHRDYAMGIMALASKKRIQLVAPRIITAEVTYQLLKQSRRRRWQEVKTAEYAELIDQLGLRYVNVSSTVASLVRYAIRNNLQGYDAQYLAVAEHLKAELATLDKGQISAAHRIGLEIAQP